MAERLRHSQCAGAHLTLPTGRAAGIPAAMPDMNKRAALIRYPEPDFP